MSATSEIKSEKLNFRRYKDGDAKPRPWRSARRARFVASASRTPSRSRRGWCGAGSTWLGPLGVTLPACGSGSRHEGR